MPDYTPEAYVAEDCAMYRVRFPDATKGVTDKELYDLTHESVDDMDDAGWKALFETKGAINLSAIRSAFEEAKSRDLRLSDELLVAIINRAGKTWKAFEESGDQDAAVKFLEKAEEEAAKVSVSDPGITALVKKLDPEIHQAINDDIEAAIKGKTTAVHILSHFRRIYTLDELNSMPVPGTEVEHVEGTNYKADKIKTKDRAGNPITVIWTNDFVSAMPEGKAYETDIDDVSKEMKTANSVPRFKGWSKSDLVTLKDDATARRNALRSIVKRTILLHHQWVAVEGMPKIGLRWIRAKGKDKAISMPTKYGEGEFGEDATLVSASVKPIWIYPQEEPSEGRNFSVTQFLAFDPAMALKAGGTMADLVATAGRGSDEEPEGEGDGSDMADDAAQATASMFYNWFNKRENQALVLKKIANRKADADGNDWLDLIGSIYLAVKPIYEKNKGAYEALQQRDEDAA